MSQIMNRPPHKLWETLLVSQRAMCSPCEIIIYDFALYLMYIINNNYKLLDIYKEPDMTLRAVFRRDLSSVWQLCKVIITIPFAHEQTEGSAGCVPCAIGCRMVCLPDSGLLDAKPGLCLNDTAPLSSGVRHSSRPVSILHNSPSSQKDLKYNKEHTYIKNKPPKPSATPQEVIFATSGHCQRLPCSLAG